MKTLSHPSVPQTDQTNEIESYIRNLLEANPLREALLRSVIQSLQLPHGSHGLDAGCGIGLQTLLLLEAVGTDGQVTGLDILPELLAYGSRMVKEARLDGQIHFRQGSVSCLPFKQNSFDWVWSADCIGYPAGELCSILKELVRVVKPGGDIFLLGWSSQQLLPGYPLLEARLNGSCSGYMPFLKGKCSEENFMRALGSFQKAGLVNVQGKTFVGEVQTPLSPGEKTAITSLFKMLWGIPQPEVSSEDWKKYQRLCTPGSSEFILDVPDYYGFYTCTLFRGRVDEHKGQ